MATCESTTLARPNRILRDAMLASFSTAERFTHDDVLSPLFIRAGDEFHHAPESLVLDCARRLVHAQFRPGAPVLSDPVLVRRFLMLQVGPRDHEVFAVILLDSRHRLIDYVELFHGTVDGAMVHPREVIRCVVAYRAASVMLVHNHPSGVSDPSLADRQVTARMKAALALIDVKVVDHLIVGESITSMAAMGLL